MNTKNVAGLVQKNCTFNGKKLNTSCAKGGADRKSVV